MALGCDPNVVFNSERTLQNTVRWGKDFYIDHSRMNTILVCLFLVFTMCTILVSLHINKKLLTKRRNITTVLHMVNLSNVFLVSVIIFVNKYTASFILPHDGDSPQVICFDLDLGSLYEHILLCIFLLGVAALGVLYIFKDFKYSVALPILGILLTVGLPIGLLAAFPTWLKQKCPDVNIAVDQLPSRLCIEDWPAPAPGNIIISSDIISVIIMVLIVLMMLRRKEKIPVMCVITDEGFPIVNIRNGDHGEKIRQLQVVKNGYEDVKQSSHVEDTDNYEKQSSYVYITGGNLNRNNDVLDGGAAAAIRFEKSNHIIARNKEYDNESRSNDRQLKLSKHGHEACKDSIDKDMVTQNYQTYCGDIIREVTVTVLQAVLLLLPLHASLVIIGTLGTACKCVFAGYHLFLVAYLTVFALFKVIIWPGVLLLV